MHMMRENLLQFYCSFCVTLSLYRLSFRIPLREKTLTSITVPSTPGGTRKEVSRTSRDFSPKIARKSFSSGEYCISPLRVTLPTKISPGLHVYQH